jgi:hypothetical protein
MTGDYRTGARILAALADAPMNAEALMHELDITGLGLGIAISYLVKDGRVEQDDRGCWYLVKADAAPAPVVARGEPAAAPAPDQRAIADVVAQLTAPRASTAISVGDQVLQVLIAAGRITQDDIQLASKLIGSRA